MYLWDFNKSCPISLVKLILLFVTSEDLDFLVGSGLCLYTVPFPPPSHPHPPAPPLLLHTGKIVRKIGRPRQHAVLIFCVNILLREFQIQYFGGCLYSIL